MSPIQHCRQLHQYELHLQNVQVIGEFVHAVVMEAVEAAEAMEAAEAICVPITTKNVMQ